MSSKHRKKHSLVAVLALGLATLVAGTTASAVRAPTAAASSEGCTYTDFPNRYVCFDINGSGLHVDNFVVIRGKLDGAGVCNYQAWVVVTSPAGSRWTYWSSYRPGCQVVRATRTIGVNANYPNNSTACGSFYENGQLQTTACNKIHS
jgi:hypothetical protein